MSEDDKEVLLIITNKQMYEDNPEERDVDGVFTFYIDGTYCYNKEYYYLKDSEWKIADGFFWCRHQPITEDWIKCESEQEAKFIGFLQLELAIRGMLT